MYDNVIHQIISIIPYLKRIQFGKSVIYSLNLEGGCKFIMGFVHFDTKRVDKT